ncbi:unnamed protein product [Trichogramma brassicae]|uniref:Uncharacterized protein n=1 Tax=Trichogramma brassicae TaxID=86971 RepID=A0A6H5IVD4_9HYME|nr:unnamed protein product [Trichogramma brassicae]
MDHKNTSVKVSESDFEHGNYPYLPTSTPLRSDVPHHNFSLSTQPGSGNNHETPKRMKLEGSISDSFNTSSAESIPSSPWEWRKMKAEILGQREILKWSKLIEYEVRTASQKLRDLTVLRARAHRWGIYRDSPLIGNDGETIDEKPDLNNLQILPFPQENLSNPVARRCCRIRRRRRCLSQRLVGGTQGDHGLDSIVAADLRQIGYSSDAGHLQTAVLEVLPLQFQGQLGSRARCSLVRRMRPLAAHSRLIDLQLVVYNALCIFD